MADEGAGGRSRREARGVRYREYEEDEVFVEPKEDRLDPGTCPGCSVRYNHLLTKQVADALAELSLPTMALSRRCA